MSPALRKFLDPYIKLAPYVGIGTVVVAIVVAWIFYIQRGAHVELVGAIRKVRTLALDDRSSAAILDFHFENPSDYPFVVRKVEAFLTDSRGQELAGMAISEVDARKLFEYYPLQLGQRYNETLTIRTKITPHQALDRMLAVRFEVPEKELAARKQLRLRIEELDGPVSNLVERGS